MAKKLGHNFICDHADTETESHFSNWITRFAIPYKFKQPHLDSYNNSGSPVDYARTYRA